MNPRFETINGKLCIMLEKPIPLTKEAKFPCIVRLIQDDSPMGRYNKWNWEGLTELTHIRELIGLPDDTIPCIECDDDEHISHYEILGYPVEEGSAEWALHQMMQGEKVCRKISTAIVYCKHTNGIGREVRDTYYVESISAWLNGADKDGWQLYKEPEQPKYKVGDWVEHEKSKEQGRITYISSDNYDAIEVKLYDQDELETYTKSDFNADFRKLSPSEVIVNIGCLSGTVERRTYFDTDKFFSLKNPEMEMAAAVINIDALDTPTRELVESLLKAQEEE